MFFSVVWRDIRRHEHVSANTRQVTIRKDS